MTTGSDLHDLVNADRIRSAIRRLFSNSLSEIVGELLQNGQRAGAHCVTFTTTEIGWTYADDGHGLLDGVQGFHTLLKLAESQFDNPTIAAQDPMGLGIHALLAHDEVQAVRFASGAYQLTLDTARWWTDPAYYSTWFERLEQIDPPVAGLEIAVTCTPHLRSDLSLTLQPRTDMGKFSPAQGYGDLLTITLDGAPVVTDLPAWVRPERVLIETTYQGCPLTIGIGKTLYSYQSPVSSVNWWGQIITTNILDSAFNFYLHVRAGRPVNPLAPSRRGLIHDAALAALVAFVKDQLFEFLFDPTRRAQIQPAWVAAYYKLDRARAEREAPYLVAAPWCAPAWVDSYEDLGGRGPDQLFLYTEAPLLLEKAIQVQVQDATGTPGWQECDYGLDSFLGQEALPPAYDLRCGNLARLQVGTFWWRPGPARPDAFHEPGEWGISFTPDQEPATWHPVTHPPVYAFEAPARWDVADVEFIAGTTDPISFYRHEAWAGFDPDPDEASYDAIRDSYEESCAAAIRALIGAAIPGTFTLDDIRRHMPNPKSRIVRVEYHYPDGQEVFPTEITAVDAQGQEKRLKLID